MKNYLPRLLRDLSWSAVAGVLTAGVAAPVSAQVPPGKPAREAAKDARDTAKDAAKGARDAAKDPRNTPQPPPAAKDPRPAPSTPPAVKDPRPAPAPPPAVKDPRPATPNPTPPAKEARDAAKDARETAKDNRDAAKDSPKDARDANKDASKDRRDPTPRTPDARDHRDAREDRRDNNRDQARDQHDNNRARNQFNINTFRSADMGLWFTGANNRLVIADIANSGPIARLGFRTDDRIVSVNGQRVANERDFVRYLYAQDVRNDRVTVIVLRDDREETIVVEPTVFINAYQTVRSDALEDFGLVLDDRVNDQVVVWRVLPRTPAYYAGIRASDVIVSFDGQSVTSPTQLATIVEKTDRDAVQVEVLREKKPRTLDVEFRTASAE